ncbi:CLUMA_CG010678, isoform A [Clunio marinus]|uniref:CLUMA_CG010678, isoform A n=1 Tax=Clunio marinus TaxID=568069 RepID=A0A1J1IAQ0_9DIPT|nr:CLUMA_CG010678, isoform A [Clunio marinus]
MKKSKKAFTEINIRSKNESENFLSLLGDNETSSLVAITMPFILNVRDVFRFCECFDNNIRTR